jgi:hypothetical protein
MSDGDAKQSLFHSLLFASQDDSEQNRPNKIPTLNIDAGGREKNGREILQAWAPVEDHENTIPVHHARPFLPIANSNAVQELTDPARRSASLGRAKSMGLGRETLESKKQMQNYEENLLSHGAVNDRAGLGMVQTRKQMSVSQAVPLGWCGPVEGESCVSDNDESFLGINRLQKASTLHESALEIPPEPNQDCLDFDLDAFLAQIELDKDIFPDEQDMQIAKQIADFSLDLPRLKILVDETD